MLSANDEYTHKKNSISEKIERSKKFNFINRELAHYTKLDELKQEGFQFGTGVKYLGDNIFQLVQFSGKGKNPEWGQCYALGDTVLELRILKYFQRWLYPHLTLTHREILRVIIDRTICWGKQKEKIRKNHFFVGIFNVMDGTGMTRPTVDKSIKELTELGLISVVKGDKPHQHYYQVNWDSLNEFVINKGGGVMLRKSNKDNTNNGEDRGLGKPKCKPDLQKNSEECKRDLQPYNRTQDPIKQEQNIAATMRQQSSVDKVKKAVDSITKTNIQNSLEKAKRRIKENKISVGSIESIWMHKVREVFPTAIVQPWTKKNFGQVKQFIRSYEMPNEKTHIDFFNFVIDKWFAIKGQHFEFLSSYAEKEGRDRIDFPNFPSIGFLMGFKTNFLNAYQKELDNNLRSDKFDRKRLLEAGYTEAEIDQVLTDKAIEEERQRVKKQDYTKALELLESQKRELARERDQLNQDRIIQRRLIDKANKQITVEIKKPLVMDTRKRFVSDTSEIRSSILPENLQAQAKKWHEQTKTWTTLEYVETLIDAHGVDEAYKMLFE